MAHNPYPELLDDNWIARTTSESTTRIFRALDKRSTLSGDELRSVMQKRFIDRAIRGFIVEFLRQEKDGVLHLNPLEPSSEELHDVKIEASSGMIHCKAILNQLGCEKQLDWEKSKKVLGTIIKETLNAYHDKFKETMNQDARGSIYCDIEGLHNYFQDAKATDLLR